MNTLKIILDKNASGKVAQLYKDFAMYVNSYQNKLVDVYVPKEMLYINAKELATNETPTNYANSVKIGGILTADDGSKKTTDSFYLDYLKETTINNVEYVVFERIMPKELTVYAGNQQIVVNVVSVDSGTTPPKVLQVVTTQICNLLIQNSDYIADETTVDPSKTEEIEAQLTTNTTDITNLKVRMTTAESNVEQNTEDIAKNTNDINYLKQHLSQTEEYIGQMTGATLPTNQQLNDFVMEKVSREPKNADVVIFVLQIPDATDKNYKYIYSVDGWNGYEIPPMEQASNGNSGIIEGTYNIGSTNNTIVDISGGQILNIYVKDTAGTFRNIREYINSNSTNIANIISGNTSVGIALKAVADELGNNIVNTYLTQTAGATKQFVYNYALPRVFNDIFYITEHSLSEFIPSNNYSFQKVTNRIGDNTLFDIEMRTKSSFELSKKNSANNTIYITADRNCVVTFRLKTQASKEDSSWTTLDIELSTPIFLQSLKLQKLEFTSIFTYLEDEVLKLKVDDKIRQILEVTIPEANQTTFTIYSNTIYPSTFNLNTISQVVYHTSGKLGEEPVFKLAPSGAITASGVSLAGSADAQLYNNVECQVVINIPIATQGYELFNENMSILGIELGGHNVRLATPYNFESGLATFKNLRQVAHSQDAVNGITYTMKCFIKISTGGDITFLVDEDNLNDYSGSVTQSDIQNMLVSSLTKTETWILPQNLPMKADDGLKSRTWDVNFTSNNIKFTQFRINDYYADGRSVYYNDTRVFYIDNAPTPIQYIWANDAYRTIIFDEPVTGTLRTWLINHDAVKQSDSGTPNKATGEIGTIKKHSDELEFYPKTFIECVYSEDGNTLDTLMPVANPTLDGTEPILTALGINGTNYKMPVDGGSGGIPSLNVAQEVLWTNPNPNQNFVAQSVNLSSSKANYDYILFSFYSGTDLLNIGFKLGTSAKPPRLDMSTRDATKPQIRQVKYIDDVTISFSNGIMNNITDNTAIIPYQIIGLKFQTHDYSTEEQYTGKHWIDGKKIYQKTFIITTTQVNVTVDVNFDCSNVDTVIDTVKNNKYYIPFSYTGAGSDWYINRIQNK